MISHITYVIFLKTSHIRKNTNYTMGGPDYWWCARFANKRFNYIFFLFARGRVL